MTRALERSLVAGAVLVAFGLRVFRLGTQSLWGDEAISVFRAAMSLREITAEVPREGTLPPLYYYLLHFWIPVAGQTEVAVRFLSLLLGVLAVPLLYVLVRRTLGARVGVLAAALAASSPFWIYYSQETRTYALVTALATLALYLLVRAGLDESWQVSPWPWCSYAVVAALATSGHYFAGFVLAAGVFWLLSDRRRWPGVAMRCLLAQVGTLALLAPLLAYVAPSLVVTAGSVSRAGIALPAIVRHLATTFSYGTSVEPERVWPLVVLAALVAGLGLVASPWRMSAFWGLALAVPVLAIYEVSFNPHRGWARYFIAASPAWYALLAAGLDALASGAPPSAIFREARQQADLSPTQGEESPAPPPPRRGKGARRLGPLSNVVPSLFAATGLVLAGLAGLGIAAGVAASLRSYYFDPGCWRYDLRSAVRQVDSVAAPDTAVVVNGPRRFPSFFYYFRETLPATEIPAPGSGRAEMAGTLASLAVRYRGLWLVKYRPPEYDLDGFVEGWLGHNAYKASLRWVENTTFSFYVTDDPAAPRVVGSFPVGRTFGGEAELAAYRASVVRAQGADYLLVDLTWRPLRTPEDDLRVFAHLLDGGGTRLAQSDHRTVDDLRPAWTWHAGEVLVDRSALRLPADYLARGLRLAVGLYRPDGRRLPPQGEPSPDNSLSLPLPGLNPLRPSSELRRQLGSGVALLGYDLAPNPVSPGGTLSLTLYWQRQGPIDRGYTVFTHLLAPGERVVAQKDSPPLGGSRPTTSWLPEEVLSDRYEIAIPPGTPPGHYQIEVGMYEPETGRRLPVLVRGQDEDGPTAEDRVLLPDVVEVAAEAGPASR